jgi:thioredoxin-dependent peroxiredoxin
MIDGGMAGLHARAVVVIDKQGKVKYNELVPSIGQEPDYEAALKSVN